MIAPMIATIMLYRLKPVTPLAPKALKMKASDDRPDNTEDNIQEKPFARFVDDLAGDETGDETQ
jgi:hypothetical protein